MLQWTARRLTFHLSSNPRHVQSAKKFNRTTPRSTSQRVYQRRYTSSTTIGSPSPRTLLARGTFYAVVTFLVGHVCTAYFFSSDITYGVSMLPTLHSFGDWVLISKYYRRGRDVSVGDVISFKHPVREGEYAVKRVIGMEGDFVLYNTPQKSDAMIQVPQGHCWVVGDNMKHSRDSRVFGPLPMALIHGKVLARWSGGFFSNFAWMEHGVHPAEQDDTVD